jgi:ribA/ribD-fused uncharacterized protein
MIDSFRGEYNFLSNFHRSQNQILVDGVPFDSVEHGYVIRKVGNVYDFCDKVDMPVWRIREMTCGQIKRLGRKVQLREDWEKIKIGVMLSLLLYKFGDPILREELRKTHGEYLVEGNRWHDNVWGSCRCEKCGDKGQNLLGQLLMGIRGGLIWKR